MKKKPTTTSPDHALSGPPALVGPQESEARKRAGEQASVSFPRILATPPLSNSTRATLIVVAASAVVGSEERGGGGDFARPQRWPCDGGSMALKARDDE